MSKKVKGVIYGIVSAISYGTNPLGALYLYEEGVNVNSVLFHRFSLAAIILAGIMLVQKKSFAINRKELLIIGALGVLFATSSLSLFSSFHYMDGGVACTLLFIYPVIVAVLMAVFFKEKMSLVTILSIALAQLLGLHHCGQQIAAHDVLCQAHLLRPAFLHPDGSCSFIFGRSQSYTPAQYA